MSLLKATTALLDLREQLAPPPIAWQHARSHFESSLANCGEPEEILLALDVDVQDVLPVELKSAAFERALELGMRTADFLRAYGWHLYNHGPDWDEKARALLEEADALEHEA